MNADEIHDENLKEFADAMGVCAEAITVRGVGFTPGPWRIGDAGKTVYGPKTGKFPAMVVVSPQSFDAISSAQRKANVKLIASAPDLYNACKMLLRAWDEGKETQDVEWECLEYAVEIAREAVSKAEGTPAS